MDSRLNELRRVKGVNMSRLYSTGASGLVLISLYLMAVKPEGESPFLALIPMAVAAFIVARHYRRG